MSSPETPKRDIDQGALQSRLVSELPKLSENASSASTRYPTPSIEAKALIDGYVLLSIALLHVVKSLKHSIQGNYLSCLPTLPELFRRLIVSRFMHKEPRVWYGYFLIFASPLTFAFNGGLPSNSGPFSSSMS